MTLSPGTGNIARSISGALENAAAVVEKLFGSAASACTWAFCQGGLVDCPTAYGALLAVSCLHVKRVIVHTFTDADARLTPLPNPMITAQCHSNDGDAWEGKRLTHGNWLNCRLQGEALS